MSRAALLALLNRLLEAERAGAQVAKVSLAENRDPAFAAILQDVQKDELKWCQALMQAIHRMEGETSRAVGDFREKALAIPDMRERLAFLNRGQGWVLRKLDEALGLDPDAETRQMLTEMRQAHDGNIARLETALT